MAFNIGLSGINAAQADLKSTGNNVANAGTIGFKSSRAEFADIYANSKYGATKTSIGSGVRVAAISQQFTQGNLSFTEKNLDLAINGEGFYNIQVDSGATVYTRNGQFQIDKDGNIVTNNDDKLLGYQVNAELDTINTGEVAPLNISTGQIEPKKTESASIIANLDASEAVSLVADIDPDDPETYTHTTSFSTFDSLGNAMLTAVYFQKNEENSWTVGTRTVDSLGIAMPGDTAATATSQAVKNTKDFFMSFSTTGKIDTIGRTAPVDNAGVLTHSTDLYDASQLASLTNVPKLPLNYSGDAADADNAGGPPTSAQAQNITLNLSNVNQYGANFSVNDLSQDGYPTGNLAGIEVNAEGLISARYTNGKSKKVGQVVLSDFNNPQGLGQVGNNNWSESSTSGEPVVTAPGSGNAGKLQSGALEEANVDLTKELIKLIISQRNFQANAKTITTSDTLTQTVIQL